MRKKFPSVSSLRVGKKFITKERVAVGNFLSTVREKLSGTIDWLR